MYRIKQISTNRYLTHPEITNWNGRISISTSKKGKIWKIRQYAIDAFKITIKTAKQNGLRTDDFVLEKYEMVVTEIIDCNNI